MANNYKELFKIKNGCWSTECPVLLETAGLFMNNNTNAVIALCKFRNVTLKKIKAVYLSVICLGVDGAILNNSVEHVYLDLSIPSNKLFGEKTPISIPDATTRKIDIVVKKVIYEDDTYWESQNDIKLQPILSAESISSLGELQEVYKWKTGFDILPLEHNDYWICRCNSLNLPANQHCINCKTEKKVVFAEADYLFLENVLPEYQQYLEQNEIARQSQADEKAEKKHKMIKVTKIVIPILLIITICASVIYAYASQPLTEIIKDSNIKKLGILLKCGKDSNHIDPNKETPLTMAIKENNMNAVQLLLQHGAEINKLNGLGKSPLDMARQINSKDLQMFLLNSGAEGYLEEQLSLTVGADLDGELIYSNPRKLSETVQATIRNYYYNSVPTNKVEYYFTGSNFGGTAIGWNKDKYMYVGTIKDNMLDGKGILYIYRSNKSQNFEKYIKLYEGGFKNGKFDGKGLLYWEYTFNGSNLLYVEYPPIYLDAEFKDGNVYGQYTRYYSDKTLNDAGTCYDGKRSSSKYAYDNSDSTRWLDIKLP